MNPFLPLNEYVPDGEPRIFNNRLYLYGSHDRAGGDNFCIEDYVVWSAPLNDLSNWQFEGVSYTYEESGASLEEAGNLAAPDCVQGPDGRYYLFYNRGARMACEVAVSNKPTGPFTYLADVAYPDGSKPQGKQFDPGVLIDEDGRIYLYTGFVPTPGSPWISIAGRYSMGFELEQDMHTIKTGPVNLLPGCLAAKNTEFENRGFYEASSPRKINGKYYLIYSSEQSHDLCYAISEEPLDGYKYGGILVSNADIGYHNNTMPKAPYGNTHGGLVEINRQWYIFYHRQTHGIECCRQACGEPIYLDCNGKFQQVEITTSGLNVEPLIGKGSYSGAYACNIIAPNMERLTVRESKRDTQPYIFQEESREGEEVQFTHYIANLAKDSVIGYKYFQMTDADKIEVNIRATQEGSFEVYLDEKEENLAARIVFTQSKEWKIFSAEFTSLQGVYPLFFKVITEGKVDFESFTLM